MSFYNLELADTNVVDHNTHDYGAGGEGLEFFPQLADEAVAALDGLEVTVVATGVCPLVGFAEGEKEDAGLARVEVIDGGVVDERVKILGRRNGWDVVHPSLEFGDAR